MVSWRAVASALIVRIKPVVVPTSPAIKVRKREAATMIGNVYDPNVIGGKENRIPSDTGGASHIPEFKITGKETA